MLGEICQDAITSIDTYTQNCSKFEPMLQE